MRKFRLTQKVCNSSLCVMVVTRKAYTCQIFTENPTIFLFFLDYIVFLCKFWWCESPFCWTHKKLKSFLLQTHDISVEFSKMSDTTQVCRFFHKIFHRRHKIHEVLFTVHLMYYHHLKLLPIYYIYMCSSIPSMATINRVMSITISLVVNQ